MLKSEAAPHIVSAVPKQEKDLDLPLSANFGDIQVKHFVLDLSCDDISSGVFECALTIFCKLSSLTVPSETNDKLFASPIHFRKPTLLGTPVARCLDTETVVECSRDFVYLDCFALDVSSCWLYTSLTDWSSFFAEDPSEESEKVLQIPIAQMNVYAKIYTDLQQKTQVSIPLDFQVTKHSLRIQLPVSDNANKGNNVIVKICYRTRAEGPSLMRARDQDERPCVFNIGHMLNNRSLLPCQDLPQALSTWHSCVTLRGPDVAPMSVVMTGEAPPEITRDPDGAKVFRFCSSYPVPASTFAIGVGTWTCSEIIPQGSTQDCERIVMPHCRLFSPKCLQEQSLCQMRKYLPDCFEALNVILGPYPLKHLDILIVPECFNSIGLACPHLLLLSQSILSSDLSMFHRLSHELCHTWFGILTGPRDWTEEWLTEGICCYLEDVVHPLVMKWSADESHERTTVRALLKKKLLASEMDNTHVSLQTLRPNKGEVGCFQEDSEARGYVRHGLNPDKTFMQVHYLKGYFLLRYLEDIAEKEHFLKTLKDFTNQHLGQLFSSEELLNYLFMGCPLLTQSGLTVTQVCNDWLDSPGVPAALDGWGKDLNVRLIREVQAEISLIQTYCAKKRTNHMRNGGCKTSFNSSPNQHVFESLPQLLPEQLVLLLELLVEGEIALAGPQLAQLRRRHNIQQANAEVKHSWCELIIRRAATRWMSDVEDFLLHHQAMGVYLYGELVISQNKKLQRLARRCFSKVQAHMPEGSSTTVREILFPT